MSFLRRFLRPIGLLLGLCLLGGVLVGGMAFPVVGAFGMVARDAGDSVTVASADLVDAPMPQTTTVLDTAGNVIARFFETNQNRVAARSEDISAAMKAAIVAVEDRRFYEHQGVDWQGTLRAALTNQAAGDVRQGASTLTQQYVKNYLLFVEADSDVDRLKATEQTPARKLREAQVALRMEQNLSKDEILTRYLNIVPFGNGAAGVTTASRTYFGTSPDQLTVAQAALLAGMVRNLAANDPVRHPERALERRNLVINQMREQQMIDDAQQAEALAAPLGVVSPLQTEANGCSGVGDVGFFCQYLREYLTNEVTFGETGAAFTKAALNRGGFTIRSTLDPAVLSAMKASLDAQVPPQTPNVADVMSIVTPGADKHRITGMAANRVFGNDGEQRQTSYGLPYVPVPMGAGSVYKIFTAAAAMEKGLGINYQLTVPASGYASPIYRGANGRPQAVGNSGDSFAEATRMTLTQALARSPNTAFVKLEEFTQIPPVVDMAVKLGLRGLERDTFAGSDLSQAQVIKDQKRASFTLGPEPTSVLELANVGATLASGGVWCPPTPIESITGPDGAPVAISEAPCEQVVPKGLADTLLVALSENTQPGGTAAAAAAAAGWNRPIAGKTGTTQISQSASFIGIVPQMSGAVITYDDDSQPNTLCDSGGVPYACRGAGNLFGGKAPARTWFGTMTPLLANQPVLPLPAADPAYLTGGAEVRVPDVIGDSQNQARGTLERAGFSVTTSSADNAARRGTVIGQSPSGTALPGEAIALVVSTGEVPPPPAAPTSEPAPPNQPVPSDQPPPTDGGDGTGGDGTGGDGGDGG